MNRIEVNVKTGSVTVVQMTAEEIAALPPPEPAPVPQSISRRQCARQMMAMNLIDGAEALAMTRTGTPPAMVSAMLAQMPQEQAILAEIDFAADTYMRSNPLLISLMTATGADSAAIDDFFRAAAVL